MAARRQRLLPWAVAVVAVFVLYDLYRYVTRKLGFRHPDAGPPPPHL